MRFTNSYIKSRDPVEATNFLRRDNRLAALLPAVERMASLQQDCAAVLPAMFSHCEVLAFEQGVLLLSAPNTALAAKLKQQTPKLQEALLKRGWQINNIKLRVQMMKAADIKPEPVSLSLSPAAVEAFDTLSQTLEQNKQNAPLIAALKNMVQKRRERPDY
ncbi:hypothetical protein GCM10027277_40640 [Pseudoduganella ginsengisoli]|uniref:DUF721 domain-containing protein n=1 Tax=Pseudoduganella ginsengisoli TaxID=1462440 RepID=A0A6L6PWG9_9BURK|nr:DciA family protein [Pseudoduganella ginsengisoli]MTW01867.1 DUF721 domain-containing protein [Pseudoduganella ginsengisoli]